jgi:hypothetical protein
MNKVSDRVRRTGLERVYRIRCENMRKIVQSMGNNKAQVARTLGLSAPFITHIAGDPPIRTIGERLARSIEQKLGLASGFMDMIH